MGILAGRSLFTCWLTKTINSFPAGSPSNPVRQKHPTQGLCYEEKMHLHLSITDVQSWKGPWHSWAVSVYREEVATKKKILCTNPLIITLSQKLETCFSSCRIQEEPTLLPMVALMGPFYEWTVILGLGRVSYLPQSPFHTVMGA